MVTLGGLLKRFLSVAAPCLAWSVYGIDFLCRVALPQDDQRTADSRGAHYTLLGIRVYRAIEIVFFGTVEATCSYLTFCYPVKAHDKSERIYTRGRVALEKSHKR